MDENSEQQDESPEVHESDATPAAADSTTSSIAGSDAAAVSNTPAPAAGYWPAPVFNTSWPPPFSEPDPEPPTAAIPLGAAMDTPPLGVEPVSTQPTPVYGQPLRPGEPAAGTTDAPGPWTAGYPGYGNPGYGTPAAGGPGAPGPGGPGWPPPPYGYGGSGGWFGPPPSAPEPPKRTRRGIALLLAGALVAGGVGAGLGVAFAPNSTNDNALQQPLGATSPTTSTPAGALSTAVITRLVSPAVVDINTVVATESGEPQQEAAGTGMIVSSNGVILTNNHVVEDAQKISVVIAGKSHPATVLGTAKSSDVALLKVSGVSGLPTVSLGDSSSVAVGDSVVAIGNALGLGGSPSSAPGYISKTGATINASSEGDTDETETLTGLFQTSAEIQPGDSGGPLVNGKGQVVGMDTAAASSDSGSTVGFAIPIATARAIALKIENHEATDGIVLGLSPYLGIFYAPSSTSGSNPSNGGYSIGFGSGLGTTTTCANGTTGNSSTTADGITLAGVAAGSPAATAGLATGDVVTSIAGHATTSQSQLTKAVSGLKPGQQVTVDYTDSCGSAHTTSLTLGGIPD